MNTPRRTALFALLSLLASPAFASAKLTPQQCQDYPFVRTKHPVTHQQLQNELKELEAVGYYPEDDDDYPQELQAAEQRLQAKYRADCLPGAGNTLAAAPDHSSTSAQQ
ncbi:DUF4148 domain-containing protein [Paraburkholderia pallida]|uniref:DUF4148 domain-containing protein n=1 Tax=Paraburkholderia pallida TaxID=2547399 RepID=A0A4P7D486_9BURK|nr:DUF4148 domain-containing protein [Paraburkholderia pallida]QBR01412.1 DUF4148 domain-containing protein [Paraburkholderia pallida]